MRYALLATLAAAGTLAASAATAMPLSNLGSTAQTESNATIQDVRLVCNEWGRCWRTGPRRGYSYYGPRSYYAPSYGYSRPYRSYGYYGYGAPSVGFSFRF